MDWGCVLGYIGAQQFVQVCTGGHTGLYWSVVVAGWGAYELVVCTGARAGLYWFILGTDVEICKAYVCFAMRTGLYWVTPARILGYGGGGIGLYWHLQTRVTVYTGAHWSMLVRACELWVRAGVLSVFCGLILVCTGLCWFVQVCTGLYGFVLLGRLYWFILGRNAGTHGLWVHTGACAASGQSPWICILVCTGLVRFILVYVGLY